MMLLIVDDNKQVRRMIRSLVEDLETEFCECEDGADALAAYREYQPDLVLMDVAMKNVDGLTATRQIKSFFPKAKVVIVTNHTDAQTHQAALAAGAVAFLGKDDLGALRGMIGS